MTRALTAWSLGASLFITGGLLIGLSLPFLYKSVGPNGAYGFRTHKTLASPAVWYRANATAAKASIVAGAAMLFLSIALIWMQRNSALSAAQLSTLGLAFEILPPTVLIIGLMIYNSLL